MSAINPSVNPSTDALPTGEAFEQHLGKRQARGRRWASFFSLTTVVALVALVALFGNIINQAFGYVVVRFEVDPTTLAPDGDLASLSNQELATILQSNRNLAVYIRDLFSAVPEAEFSNAPLSRVLAGRTYDPALADATFGNVEGATRVTPEQAATILADNASTTQLVDLVRLNVVREQNEREWGLIDSLFNRAEIERIYEEEYGGKLSTDTDLYFRAWLSLDFILSPQSSEAEIAGIRTAIFGTLWTMAITVVLSFTIGVSAAIYLEEYSRGGWLDRFIETNVRNLAGVPSIIYGLLGLAVFVRTLEAITQGRTIISAALTMSLLILPVIIINAQEALRAVPPSLREASFGLGATRWQTIWSTVLPTAMPGILTGTILAMSRAIGETAPLIIIGASTTIFLDPSSPLDKFTVLPIQVYQWTSRPQDEFRSIAAAGIIVLLVLLITLNATAIILRQRIRKGLQA
jgi:phosphate transport system permease protein